MDIGSRRAEMDLLEEETEEGGEGDSWACSPFKEPMVGGVVKSYYSYFA